MKRIVAALSCLMLVSLARADAPPEAKTIIEKVTAALGGKESLPKSCAIKGTLTVVGQNITGQLELLEKGNNAIMRMNIGGLGVVEQGVHGDIAYETSEMMGTRLLTGDEKKQLLSSVSSNEQLNRLEKLKDIQVTGPVELDGSQAWQLVGKGETGDEETHWIDTKTFLPSQMKMTAVTQMGKIEAMITLKDYKEFAGVKIPTRVTQSAGPMSMELKFIDVKMNAPLDDKIFALPPGVQKLVDKAAAASQPATQPDTTPGGPTVVPALP
jgi:hypothetical protein